MIRLVLLLWSYLLLLLSLTQCSDIPKDYKYNECSPDQDVCEYWLKVKEKLTMIYGKDLVYAHEGKLYKYNEDHNNATTDIPVDKVVTVDGVNRMVIAINDTVPGPPLVVYEHQTLIIHVKNYLLSDSVTIHWHGLHQRDTPWMDGVGYISQCPIAAGQSFTYIFTAYPKGTFWYHSHVGAQRTNGVYGALIIKEKPVATKVYPTDVIMTVGDWHHESSEEVYIKMVYGNFIGRDKFNTTHTQDGGKFSGVPWVSGLIEGKGRYYNPRTGELVKAPITWYNVKKGSVYRFRVIHVGTIYPLRISIDSHEFEVIASDGYDLKPKVVESFIINPGERFDFLFSADQDIDNYWVRANSMEFGVQNHTSEAVLHYEGASMNEPTTERRKCTVDNTCTVINCPFKNFPIEDHIKCVLFSDLENARDNDPAPEYKDDSEEHFLNFAFPGVTATPGAVNGRKFEFPGVNSLTQGDEIDSYDCDRHDCGVDKVCYCHYQLQIPFNKTIQMVWLNKGSGAGWGHPIHLHGHSFYVLKMQYPPQNATTGKLFLNDKGKFVENDDIHCGNGKLNFCNAASWKNDSWINGNIPGLNLKNPPRKDTLIIPTGGYAVIRIRSDNPGKWFMHCHIEVHALDGMAMVLSEAFDAIPAPPKGFPVCNNFYNDQRRDYAYQKDPIPIVADCPNDLNIVFIAVIVVLGVIVLILTAVCIYLASNKRRRTHADSEMLPK